MHSWGGGGGGVIPIHPHNTHHSIENHVDSLNGDIFLQFTKKQNHVFGRCMEWDPPQFHTVFVTPTKFLQFWVACDGQAQKLPEMLLLHLRSRTAQNLTKGYGNQTTPVQGVTMGPRFAFKLLHFGPSMGQNETVQRSSSH